MYRFDEELGKGAQAIVYKTRLFNHENVEKGVYAIKQTHISYLLNPNEDADLFLKRWNNLERELTILKQLNSPYIIKVHEFIQTKKYLYLVQDFVNGGNLEELQQKKFSEPVAKKILK